MRSSRTDLDFAFQLVSAVQDLSRVRDLGQVAAIVCRAARALTGSDGATLGLRDGARCHVIGEDSVAPLWKDQHFALEESPSGWAIRKGERLVIEDVTSDGRVAADRYRATFVKSLAIVPIRPSDPLGAIGNFWAQRHAPSDDEIRLLEILAVSAAAAIENIQTQAELQRRARERSEELQVANRELETFSFTVAHDLRAPIRAIEGYAELLLQPDLDRVEAKRYLDRICHGTRRMNTLIDETLKLARISSTLLNRVRTDLSRIAAEVAIAVRSSGPEREVRFTLTPDAVAEGDPELLRIALENLIGNAWKFTALARPAEIEFGVRRDSTGPEYFVRDNGVGFDATATRLFEPFQRFHSATEFPGNGIGLASVRRIVEKHGGRIRAESTPGHGATFYFTLP